jgi:Ca-activated chloride channel family protein
MAARTGGRYYRATEPEALDRIMDQIDRLERQQVRVGEVRDYRELYHWLVLPGLILLTIELGLGATWLRSLP